MPRLDSGNRLKSEHPRNANPRVPSSPRGPPSDIEVLRAQVRQIEERRRVTTALQFGLAEIDARLPAGGLALGALHEAAGGGNGAIDGAAAALFVAGIAARTRGKVLWCLDRPDLFAPALPHADLKSDRSSTVADNVRLGVQTCPGPVHSDDLKTASPMTCSMPKSIFTAARQARGGQVADASVSAGCSFEGG